MKPVVNEVVDDKALIKKLQKELKQAKDAIKALAKKDKVAAAETTPTRVPRSTCCTPQSSSGENPSSITTTSDQGSGSGSNEKVHGRSSDDREQRLETSGGRDHTPNHSRIEPSPLASPDVTPERVASPNNITHNKPYDISLMDAVLLDNRLRSCDQDSRAERSIQHDCSSTISDLSSRRPPTIRVVQDSPPSEVTIIRSPLSDIGDDVDINVRLNDAEERAKFLEEKLEAADRLVELMTRDLRNARLCIHELVFRNVRLENQLANKSTATVPSTVDMSESRTGSRSNTEDDSHNGAMMTSERIGI